MSLRRDGSIDLRMVELLVCPLTKGRLVWDRARAELISPVARLAYPVRDGIPVMLPSEARTTEDDEIGAKTLPES